jgi:hypothetical protein
MVKITRVTSDLHLLLEEEFIKGDCHIVCVACNGLTHLNVYAVGYAGLPHQEVTDIAEESVEKGKAITLFPKAKITTFSSIQIEKTIDLMKQCLKINETLVKSPKIYFFKDLFFNDTASELFELFKNNGENLLAGLKVTKEIII